MKAAARLGAALAAIAGGVATSGHAEGALEPYQMVRSLQLVQDRIAAGDHAAMPMQAKLLAMIDARLRAGGADDLKDPKNLRALLVYGMSGGNPATIAAAAARVEMDAADKTVAEGVIDYLGGRPAAAIKAFEPVEPMTLPSDIGAFVALVKGSLLATEDPPQALRLLDEARLLSPGTLVEEAALRRSVGIAVETGDAARFALASTQYAERFLHSPYASQFADSFVEGVIALNMSLSLDRVADVTAMMDAEREKVIYLRIARRAAIDGLADLSAFASAKAERQDGGRDGQMDPRALLYASLSTMTSATVDDLRATLKKIDRSQLSDGDRSLLDAAKAITQEMTAPPAIAGTDLLPPALPVPPPAAPAKAAVRDDNALAGKDRPAPGTPGPAGTADASGLLPVEGAASEPPAVASAAQAEASAASPAAPAPVAANAAPPANAADETIADTKRKLAQIDQLLGASPQ
jgi:chemotaxis protein MotC